MTVTTVCPGFVETADDPDGFGDAVPDVGRRRRRRIARLIARRKGGVVSFPAADGAADVADRPAAGRDRRPAGRAEGRRSASHRVERGAEKLAR